MSLLDTAAWPEIQNKLKQRLPEVIFNQWFAGAEMMSRDGCHFEVGVQNRFFKSRIETKYMSDLCEAVREVFGRDAVVTVSVSPRLLAAFRKAQEASREEPVEVALAPPCATPRNGQAADAAFKPRGARLNPDYTFAKLVVGSSNRLSHAVGTRAVERPGEYNPLYFCGQHGVGKTHLLQAICHSTRERRPDAKVVYTTCERFVSDFSSAATNNRLHEFRDHYRRCDMLAFDELQALGTGRKVASQVELLGLIEEFVSTGKQVVFGATHPPAELEGIDSKLRDRLGGGFVDRLSLPDEKTRRELIAKKLAERGLEIPKSAVAMMARELSGNVRKLEGTVQRLAALIEFEGMEPTTSCIRMALEVSVPGGRKSALTFADVIAAVAEEYGLTPEAVAGRGRTAAMRKARQLAIALCRQVVGGRYAELGEVFGGRSHATVISAVKKIPREQFLQGVECRAMERILFRLGVGIKPEDVFTRQPGLFDKL